MDNQELLIGILEDQGLEQNQIADIMAELAETDTGSLDPSTPSRGILDNELEHDLRVKYDLETDWRVKAKLMARIISNSLD